MDLWTHEPMDLTVLWNYGPLDLWTYGPTAVHAMDLDLRTHGPMDPFMLCTWTSGPVLAEDLSAYGPEHPMDLWTSGSVHALDLCTYGPVHPADLWTHEPVHAMDLCTSGPVHA